MRTKLAFLCLFLFIAVAVGAFAGGSVNTQRRTVHYSQMMIKLDGTIVSTQDNGATWTWAKPTHRGAEVRTTPESAEGIEMMIVSDILGNIKFQGSEDEWMARQYDQSLRGALLIVTKRANGVSTTERIIRTK